MNFTIELRHLLANDNGGVMEACEIVQRVLDIACARIHNADQADYDHVSNQWVVRPPSDEFVLDLWAEAESSKDERFGTDATYDAEVTRIWRGGMLLVRENLAESDLTMAGGSIAFTNEGVDMLVALMKVRGHELVRICKEDDFYLPLYRCDQKKAQEKWGSSKDRGYKV